MIYFYQFYLAILSTMLHFESNHKTNNSDAGETIKFKIFLNLNFFLKRKIAEGIINANPSVVLFINIKTEIKNVLLILISSNLVFNVYDIK